MARRLAALGRAHAPSRPTRKSRPRCCPSNRGRGAGRPCARARPRAKRWRGSPPHGPAPHRADHAGRAPRARRRSRRPASPAIWSSRCAPPRSPHASSRRRRLRSATAADADDSAAPTRRAGTRPLDPGRRGQRDQRAAGARAAGAARPPPDDRGERRRRARSLARRARAPARRYDLVLMDVHMPGMRRHRGDAAHPRRRSRARRAAHADHRADRQCLRRGSRRLPRRRHGRLSDQAARPRAAGGAQRWRGAIAASRPTSTSHGDRTGASMTSRLTAAAAPLPRPGGSRPSSG